MKINLNTGRVNARVRGVTQVIRDFAARDKATHDAAKEGCRLAADHLRKKVQNKHGVYQPGWAKLSTDYKYAKAAKYGTTGNPLVASGNLKKSWFVKKSEGKALSASVTTNNPYAIFHIAPQAGSTTPKRDPLFPTVDEEAEAMTKIIRREVNRAVRNAKR